MPFHHSCNPLQSRLSSAAVLCRLSAAAAVDLFLCVPVTSCVRILLLFPPHFPQVQASVQHNGQELLLPLLALALARKWVGTPV